MKPNLIIIRGSPGSGKSTLVRNLTKKLKGKVALLIVDEFRWIMTAHENRDKKDYEISFDNFLYSLKNYLKSGYTIIVEDSWIRKHNDKSTDINKVINLGKKYKAKIVQILLKGSWKTVKNINTLRPMVIPQKELKESYEKVYSKNIKDEIVIDIDDKKPDQILKESLRVIDN
ncbi:MAG: AAA family ATPase [Nanoarchaeota archaeon]